MALLFETPFPHTLGKHRCHLARMISTAGGNSELQNFCRRLGIHPRAINDGVVHISGQQMESARLAGAREVSPQQLDKLIRSKTHG